MYMFAPYLCPLFFPGYVCPICLPYMFAYYACPIYLSSSIHPSLPQTGPQVAPAAPVGRLLLADFDAIMDTAARRFDAAHARRMTAVAACLRQQLGLQVRTQGGGVGCAAVTSVVA